MNNKVIANAIMTALTSFLSNGGAEIAKNFGKDLYSKIKNAFHKEEQRRALDNLEAEPLSDQYQEELKKQLIGLLSNKDFYQEITQLLHFTPAKLIILKNVMKSIHTIETELNRLYPWWTKASIDKQGEYQNRIEQLELQLLQLQEKVFVIL